MTPSRSRATVAACVGVLLATGTAPAVGAEPEVARALEGRLVVVDHLDGVAHDGHAGHRHGTDLPADVAVQLADGRSVTLPPSAARSARPGSRVRVTWSGEADGAAVPRSLRSASGLRVRPAAERRTVPVDGRPGLAAETDGRLGTLTAHTVEVLPVYFDAPGSAEQVGELVATFEQDTHRHWQSATGGRVSVAVSEVHPWTQLPRPASCSAFRDFVAAAAEAVAFQPAADAPTHHLAVYTPDGGCGFASGIASVAGAGMWLRGEAIGSLTAHEFGHNLGLLHADSAACADSASGPWHRYGDSPRTSCAAFEYGDAFDVMGDGVHGPGGQQLDVLGALDPATAPVLGSTAEVLLAPLHASGPVTAPAVRSVTFPVGGERLTFDHRADVPGADSGITAAPTGSARFGYFGSNDVGPGAGVTVTTDRFAESAGNGPALVVPTVDAARGFPERPAVYGVGQTWANRDGTLRMTVLSVDASGARIRVERGTDTVAPTGLTLDEPFSVGGELTVSWTLAEDADSGVAGYDVELDGRVVDRAGPDVTSVTLTGVADGTHEVAVTVRDAAGNTARVARTITTGMPPRVAADTSGISAGQPVTVHYSGSPGATLDVLARTQPATAYTKVASVTLDASGFGSTTHRPQKNTRITARTAAGLLSEDQPVIAVRSVASFNVARVGTRTYEFSGRVYPARSQRLVNVYRDGVLAAQARTDAAGVYRVRRTIGAGTYGFHVRTPDDTHNLGTTSRFVPVRVY